ncbi:hypothetical protein D3C86_1739990 [compost metagenome]
MTGKQLEQLIRRRLAVERGNAVGDFAGVVDHQVGRDLGLFLIAGLVGQRIVADPENMLDP